MQTRWAGDKLTVIQDTQRFDPDTGGMDITVHGEITASGEEWLRLAVQVLAMLPGKVGPDGTGFLLGPADADPDMIGSLVAAMLRDTPPFR